MARFAILLLLLPSLAGARSWPPSVSGEQRDAVERMEQVSGRPVAAAFDEHHGTVTWLSGNLGALDRPDAAAAMSWLLEHRSLWRLRDPLDQLRFASAVDSPHGARHLTFSRIERGVLVYGAEITLHLDPRGVVTGVSAAYPPDLPIVTGALTPSAAIRAASLALRATGARLGAYHPVRRVLVEHDGRLHEAWDMALLWADATDHAVRALVSARTGEILRQSSLIQSETKPAKGKGSLPGGQTVNLNVSLVDGKHYVLSDLTKPLGNGSKLATFDADNATSAGAAVSSQKDFVSTDGVFKDPASVAVHHYLGQVFDYFHTTHGWTSWDGKGSTFQGFAHFGSQLNNAYWSGGVKAMVIGDGDGAQFTQLASCLDVIGHEYGHAVVDGNLDLAYENEAGAINEHLADVFGTFVDPPNGGPTDWWIGESCMGAEYPTPFIRSLKDPGKGGLPGHAYDFVSLPNTEDGDFGGVHVNCGIPNKVAYLVIASLGQQTSEKITFEMLRGKYLKSQAGFRDLRNAWVSACQSVASASDCDKGQGAFDQAGIKAQGAAVTCPAGATAGGKFGCQCPEGLPFSYATGVCGGTEDCGGVPGTGVCEGGVLKVCVSGTVVTKTCGQGTTCGWAAAPQAGFQCVAKASCGDVPASGTCDGGQALWCDQGELKSLDCAIYGKTCANAQCVAYGASACVPSCAGSCGGDGCGGTCGFCPSGQVCQSGVCADFAAEGCGSVTFEGQCTGGRLSYCEEGTLIEADCAAAGGQCAYDEKNQFFDCAYAQSAVCGGVTAQGTCGGATLSYCEDATLKQVDCAAIGLQCGFNATAKYYDCLDPGASECGDVTWTGLCDGDAVTWCEKGHLKTLQCASAYQTCEYALFQGFYNCVNFKDPPLGEEGPSRDGGFFCSAGDRGDPGPTALLIGLLLASALLVRRRSTPACGPTTPPRP